VIFAPGLRTAEEIREVRAATSKPLNVLAHRGLTVRDAVAAGAQRISLGGALTWTAVEAMARAAEQIRDTGDLSVLASPARIREWLAG
jgi:2-methylisocitrate lyase-like PEP mutase family enzyme